jgi:hypothetical protein
VGLATRKVDGNWVRYLVSPLDTNPMLSNGSVAIDEGFNRLHGEEEDFRGVSIGLAMAANISRTRRNGWSEPKS